MILMVIENVPVFLDMVPKLIVGLQSKAKSNMADISRKWNTVIILFSFDVMLKHIHHMYGIKRAPCLQNLELFVLKLQLIYNIVSPDENFWNRLVNNAIVRSI